MLPAWCSPRGSSGKGGGSLSSWFWRPSLNVTLGGDMERHLAEHPPQRDPEPALGGT